MKERLQKEEGKVFLIWGRVLGRRRVWVESERRVACPEKKKSVGKKTPGQIRTRRYSLRKKGH